ncbi:MAG TPA: NCS2 family permease [Marine Group III euryarchaeote]|uniref:NCS2 family permease n=1 Tax=Marine Group III euryarchaeote TaxID=2173149 RepID=A0A7J4CZM8_9ARCH|nr:NCS2 family permease [Marine Group III euryarchaeote]
MLEDMFDLAENKTDMNTELMAGLTTFLATAYIIFVNPQILGNAFANYGIENNNALVTATVLVSAFSSIAMGVYARNPIVLAPGMGLNAFFTYTVTAPWGMGIHPYVALGAVFWSGVIFILLSVFNIRTEIMRAIPVQLRYGVAVGIGLFLALLGFADHSNFIQHTPDVLGGVPIVVLGNMFPDDGTIVERLLGYNQPMIVFIVGLMFTGALVARKQAGALIIGIFATTAFAFMYGRVLGGDIMVTVPDKIVAMPDFSLLAAIFMNQDYSYIDADGVEISVTVGLPIVESLKFAVLPAMFAFLFTDMFDSISTFVGVSEVGGLNDENGEPRNIKESLIVDGVSTTISGLLGSSPGTSYIESAAGIEAGGRSGLTAAFAGLLFIPFLFLAPAIGMVPLVASAPILVIIGLFMCKPIAKIDWGNFENAFPAFMAMILIPLTFSITQGIIWGFLTWTAVKIFVGKFDQISIPLWCISVFSILALLYAD